MLESICNSTINSFKIICLDDKDCALDMNYICQSGKCACTSTTYYVSAKVGCGILMKLNKIFYGGKNFLIFDFFVELTTSLSINKSGLVYEF